MTRLPALFLIAALPAVAQSVTSDPIGFNKVTCLNNSDTIVGVPLRKEGSQSTKLSADPVTNPDTSVTLAVTATLSAGQFSKHYAKFVDGAKDGSWYDITANDTSSITIDLNGDTLSGVVAGDSLVIAEHWTLDTLFDPAIATTDPTTTGHAIVASTNTLSTGRRTELQLPDRSALGTNLPPFGRYYIHGGIWKLSGGGNTDWGSLMLEPDSFMTIRHPSSVSQPTTFRCIGEVELGTFTVPLNTIVSGEQDNLIGIPRPVNLTLEDLDLRGSLAFVSSTNTLSTGRRDQLLVFDNEIQLRNKAPSARYYVHNNIWKLSGGGNTDRGTDVLPAGSAFIIRKYQTLDGATVMWNNTAAYNQ